MIRQPLSKLWVLARGTLLLGLVTFLFMPALAWGGGRQHGVHLGGPHRHFSPRHFFGFHFHSSPFFYRPYAYESYSPGEHRRFPAFRLPGFFHYPGALGKAEEGNRMTWPPRHHEQHDLVVPRPPQGSAKP
jgi:hypothetical protein